MFNESTLPLNFLHLLQRCQRADLYMNVQEMLPLRTAYTHVTRFPKSNKGFPKLVGLYPLRMHFFRPPCDQQSSDLMEFAKSCNLALLHCV